MRVIGGAGGELNMLKLRGIKSPEDCRTDHSERAMAKRNRMKDQERRDKELGIHDANVLARKELKEQRKAAERSFIKTVAEAMEWDDATLNPFRPMLTAANQKKGR